jgi:Right handed beta helix region
VRCDPGNGGSSGAYITLLGLNRPRLTGTGDQLVRIDCNYFRLKGFDVAGPARVGGTNVYPAGGNHDELIDNWIHGSICQGVSMDSSTSDYVIEGNRVYDNGMQATACDQQAHGLYVQGDRHRIRNNLVYGNRTYGVQLYPIGSNNLVAYNTIVGNGVTTGKSGIVLGGSSLMVGNRLVSNITAYNGAWGIHVTPGNGSCDIHGNLGYGNPAGDVEPGFPAGCAGLNYHGDPRFADRAAANFHELQGSAAVDLGDLLFTPPLDFDALARPLGAGPDIGAYER